MLNTILVNLDKTLEKTSFRTIYQKESRIDEIQFLIDSKLLGEDIQKNYKIILQAILPIEDKEHNSPTTNKMRYMDLEEDLYKNRYRTLLPITTTLTEAIGDVTLWLLIFDMTDTEKIKLLKTSPITINIKPSSSTGSSELEDNDFDNILTNLQNEVEDIKKNKIDKKFDYNEEDNTILFYSNGEPIGNPIKLDDEITWSNWE